MMVKSYGTIKDLSPGSLIVIPCIIDKFNSDVQFVSTSMLKLSRIFIIIERLRFGSWFVEYLTICGIVRLYKAHIETCDLIEESLRE